MPRISLPFPVVVAAGKVLTVDNSLTLAGVDGKTLTVDNSLTLAGVDGKTLTVDNSLAFAGTDGTTFTFPAASDTVATLAGGQTFSVAVTFNVGLTSNGNVNIHAADLIFSGSGPGIVSAGTMEITSGSTTLCTLGKTGGSGPATATMHKWLAFTDHNLVASFIPYWQ